MPADLIGRRVERVEFRGYRCLEPDALRVRAVAVGAPLVVSFFVHEHLHR